MILRTSVCVRPTKAMLVIRGMCTLVAVSTTTTLLMRIRSPRLFINLNYMVNLRC
nr:MAG TPA: hypothetical protein [Caudoviricetes sp.]